MHDSDGMVVNDMLLSLKLSCLGIVAGIERDAVSIFTKYIAQDAPQPIGVDDALRGETISK